MLINDGIASWGQADPRRSFTECKHGFWTLLLSAKLWFSLIWKLFQLSLYSQIEPFEEMFSWNAIRGKHRVVKNINLKAN